MRRFAYRKFQITTNADSKLSYTPCYMQCGFNLQTLIRRTKRFCFILKLFIIMELRKFIATTIREHLNENQINNLSYDDLFIKLAWLKYYGEGTKEEIRNIPKLDTLLKSTPKPKMIPIPEDTRTEYGGIKLGEVISVEELPKVYARLGHWADDSTGKFKGEYKLMYVPVVPKLTKYSLSDDYEDLEHFDRVNEYANVLRSGEELPPIIYTNGLFRDGAHRMAAHNDVGRRKILAFYSAK